MELKPAREAANSASWPTPANLSKSGLKFLRSGAPPLLLRHSLRNVVGLTGAGERLTLTVLRSVESEEISVPVAHDPALLVTRVHRVRWTEFG